MCVCVRKEGGQGEVAIFPFPNSKTPAPGNQYRSKKIRTRLFPWSLCFLRQFWFLVMLHARCSESKRNLSFGVFNPLKESANKNKRKAMLFLIGEVMNSLYYCDYQVTFSNYGN